MRTGKPILVVVGVLLAMLGLGLVAVGFGATWVHATQRDADGYLTTPTYELRSESAAIMTDEVTLDVRPSDWWPSPRELDLRVEVTSASPGGPVFVGLADAADAASYLDGVATSEIVRLGPSSDDVGTTDTAGGPATAPPGTMGFWTQRVEGVGTQTLSVDPAPGRWVLVVMNADGSPGVDVTADLGVRTGLLLPFGLGLGLIGLVVIGLGTGALVLGATLPSRPDGDDSGGPVTAPGAAAPLAPAVPTAAGGPRLHPVVLEGWLDPDVSRGSWLVKWLLVIPHVVVLAFLWAAFAVLTVFAGIAILFTGRYPRGIFDFNRGVLRWTWRVTYYSYGALATDVYPPFTLGPVPDYPATLDVEYPPQLSRGLVLVKWWLLVLPHYIVVGIISGGLLSWTVDVGAPDGAQFVFSSGLVGVLVLVAGVVLLVGGRYPRGLFDLVVGLQRWVYRVIAYAALMTDEYPPFRLDMGGSEPTGGQLPDPPATPPDGGPRRELTNA